MNENESITYQNLWNAEEIIPANAHIKKEERSEIIKFSPQDPRRRAYLMKLKGNNDQNRNQ